MPRTSSRFSVTARYVFPISSPHLEHGVVEIEGDQITAVHNRVVPHAIDLGNVAIIPGLVNAHTHLEFSDLTQPVAPALPFTQWIKSLVGVRREHPATAATLRLGLTESVASGTRLLGEIATQDWPAAAFQQSGLRTTVFRELLGLLPDRAAAQLAIARQWLNDKASVSAGPDTSGVTRGLSPHAPYSVHPDLYRDLVKLAAERQAPVAVHLAETPAELELLDRGTGEFVEMLQRFNAWDPHIICPGTRPLDYLQPLSALPRALVIHGNYLVDADLDWLEQHPQVSVVYCPRTHAYFQHPPHPWLGLLDRGINVALGTDSRGSNPDLSVWREMQFLVRSFPQVDPARILALGTRAGAQALGHATDAGTLEPGKRADFAIVNLPAAGHRDPYQLLFASDAAAPFQGSPTDDF